MPNRWRIEPCSREDGETWTQTWWSTAPLDDLGKWSDFPTWRQALAYVNGQIRGAPDGLTHDADCWCYDCRTMRGIGLRPAKKAHLRTRR